jgi:tRNA-splicing ligase RtcB
MSEAKLTGTDLLQAGWQPGPEMGAALDAAEKLLADNHSPDEVLAHLNRVRETPAAYQADPLFGVLAERLLKIQQLRDEETAAEETIRAEPIPYQVWGDGFEDITLQQMDNAAHLPISLAGALMPDGHPGYGLPIGGVLATDNSVIPYGVGMDIACRLRLSIFPEGPELLNAQRERFRKALLFNTRFGIGRRDGEWSPGEQRDHPLLDDPRWRELPILRRQYDKAVAQLGTSGASNHFAEWIAFTALEDIPQLDLQAGDVRLAFVTHSGSRGVGATIAQEYTRVAKDLHPNLPKQLRELAWLDLDSEAGQEYWLAMQVAGDFASACHQTIHETVLKAAGLEASAYVENHHNFAWEEEHGGRKVVVHRKGATPAAKGRLGVIPGTMADKGYLVLGLGNPESLNSSSHGAGRPRSRTASKAQITRNERDKYLRRQGVELLNPDAGVDEAPQAYKDPEQVINQQLELARPIGTFMPLMVMMASDKGSMRSKKTGGKNKGAARGKKKRRR